MAAYDSFSPTAQEEDQLLLSLPKHKGWVTTDALQYQGFWYSPKHLRGVLTCHSHFQALDSDLLLVTMPKSGTTWLKALVFALVNRHRYKVNAPRHHPLTTHNPHDLVPSLETKLYVDNKVPDLSTLPSPRLFGSHMPLTTLLSSVRGTSSKIVYLCRDPRDMLVSHWHFANKIRNDANVTITSLEEVFEGFCKGISPRGPFWDHVLGYWKASLEMPSRVLFLKYEDMKGDPESYLRRLAEFSGCPFSLEEEKEGIVDAIVGLCSFDSLSSLEVNRGGKQVHSGVENKAFFRRGEVGDWRNYLTSEMSERLDKIIEEKLHGSGLSFHSI